MNNRKKNTIDRIFILINTILMVSAFYSAYYLRNLFFADRLGHMEYFNKYIWVMTAYIPFVLIFLHLFGGTWKLQHENIFRSITKIFISILFATLIISSLFYLISDAGLSRLFLGIYSIISFLYHIISHFILRIYFRYLYKNKINFKKVIVIGTCKNAMEYVSTINNDPQLMTEFKGYVLINKNDRAFSDFVLGTLDQLEDILKSNVIDEVVFSIPSTISFDIKPYIDLCRIMGLDVMIFNTHPVIDLYSYETGNIGNIPYIKLNSFIIKDGELALKRFIDIALSLFGILFTSLLLPLISFVILIESKGPVFFTQRRIGKNGRCFKIYKFRTMRNDAEALKKTLIDKNEMNGHVFKMKDDPRITNVGKFLRKTSLDELPQFINVLMGDMSIVGTRPPTVDEVCAYSTRHWKRLCIKPGITGMWQVSGRNTIVDFDEIVKLDIEYIDKWSIWLDIKILFKTVLVVIKGVGAS